MRYSEYRDRRLAAEPSLRAEYEALGPEYTFIRTVIAARLASGLTQSELAQRIGTSQPAIARLESGGGLPNTRTLLRLAKALNLTFQITPDQTIEALEGRSAA